MCNSIVAALVALLLSACVAAPASSEETLRDAIFHYNDAVRWGRVGSAMESVSARARDHMMRRRLVWLRTVRIADAALVDVVHDRAHDRATVLVTFSWYRDDDPYLQQTTFEQTWRDLSEGWRIVRERVVDGVDPVAETGEHDSETRRD